LPKDVAAGRRADPEAAVFLVEYADGFRAAAYVGAAGRRIRLRRLGRRASEAGRHLV